jgi:tRNA G18 (ribose-2'-O)-methylase SpoU
LRASAGSALRLPVMRGLAIPILLAQFKVAGVKIYAAQSAPGVPDPGSTARGISSRADLREAAAIFVGSEGGGVPAAVLHAADAIISIPTSAAVESLNAGVAASIVLYEAARQRTEQSQAASEL